MCIYLYKKDISHSFGVGGKVYELYLWPMFLQLPYLFSSAQPPSYIPSLSSLQVSTP